MVINMTRKRKSKKDRKTWVVSTPFYDKFGNPEEYFYSKKQYALNAAKALKGKIKISKMD